MQDTGVRALSLRRGLSTRGRGQREGPGEGPGAGPAGERGQGGGKVVRLGTDGWRGLCGGNAFVRGLTANPEKLSKKQNTAPLICKDVHDEPRVPSRDSSGPDGCLVLAIFTAGSSGGAETTPLVFLRALKRKPCSPQGPDLPGRFIPLCQCRRDKGGGSGAWKPAPLYRHVTPFSPGRYREETCPTPCPHCLRSHSLPHAHPVPTTGPSGPSFLSPAPLPRPFQRAG